MKKHFLFGFIYLFFAIQGADAQEVTFQGAIERGAGVNQAVEIGVEISFLAGFGYVRENIVVTIPAGHSKVSYEKTLPWSFADQGLGYLMLGVQCVRNCKQGNVRTARHYYREGGSEHGDEELFGENQRDDAYIANFTLDREASYVSGRLTLPNELVAQQDIDVDVFFDARLGSGYNWWLNRFARQITIKSGDTGASFTMLVDLELANWGLYVGYRCVSSSCKQHHLAKNGWLGQTNDDLNELEMVNGLASSVSIFDVDSSARERGGSLVVIDSSEARYALPAPLTLIEASSTLVRVERSNISKASKTIKGRVVVYKAEHKIECWGSQQSVWTGDDQCSLDNLSGGDLRSFEEVISETPFLIQTGSPNTTVNIPVEPLLQDTELLGSNAKNIADYLYLAFICDEGCDDFPNQKQGFYRGVASAVSGTNSASAYRFYLTEDFSEAEIVINLGRAKVLPWLSLILDDG